MLTAMGVALLYAIRTGWRSIGLIVISVISFCHIDDVAVHAVLQQPRAAVGAIDSAVFGVGIRDVDVRAVDVEHVEVDALPVVLGVRDVFWRCQWRVRKMPWLLAQLTLPFIFVAGHGFGHSW